ncbi:RNA-binding protein Nova [Clonorchis sinensis]|uniref:RNA-binding protein Nova n=1 Tax=Clonorchis sinensis TaxID=79923 RepID=H2KSL8_CLOSI|nr:RNA-binding protein Nova [Clonorchis sinensis]
MSGSHSSSDDSNDSRKRPPDDVLLPETTPKRANCDDNVHLKVLIPSIAAGAVIGKYGEAIGKIQKDTNTKVKISKQDEFYPGTTERVCLIVGSMEGVMSVHNYIMDRILEKPDPNPHATCEGRLNVERHKQVKILVPNSTAGMVIGKGGSYIQEIKEKTGAYVQISQKSREFNLLERCIIIAGDLDQTRAAVQLILAVIAADPQSASCPNLSYHDVRGPVASVYPTGSPYATPLVPCATTPTWLATQAVDPSAANTAAMMAAVFAPGSVGSPGAVPTGRSAHTFGFFSGSYGTPPDISPLAALAASSPTLGLTSVLQSGVLSSPSGGGGGSTELVPPSPGSFPSSPPQTGISGSLLDPTTALAAAAQQAALLAAFRSKTQMLPHELSDPTASLSTLVHQASVVPVALPSSVSNPGPFRVPPAWVGYPVTGITTPTIASAQQAFSGSRLGQSLVDPQSSSASGASGTSSASSSPSVAASVALAALSAAATGGGTTGSGVLSNPGALLGMMQPPSMSPALNLSFSRADPLSLTVSNLSTTSPSLFLALNEQPSAVASAPTSPPSLSLPSHTSMFGLYAFPGAASPTLSMSPVASSAGSYMFCKKVIAVPESIIGLLLGPQGRSIVDLQASSGTVIQVSQKGVYAPGTQNRLVTITGPQLNVQWAANVIEQRVAVEQLRRESSGSTQPFTPPAQSEGQPEASRRLSFLLCPQSTALSTDPTGHTSLSQTLEATLSAPCQTTVTASTCSVKRENDGSGYQKPP